MNKVVFTYRSGREREMSETHARILQKLGHGKYMTRDMRADVEYAFPGSQDRRTIQEIDELIRSANAGGPYANMGAEELHALAKSRGVKVHHKAGAEKVRQALREADE